MAFVQLIAFPMEAITLYRLFSCFLLHELCFYLIFTSNDNQIWLFIWFFVVRFERLNSALNANATLFPFCIKPVSDQLILDPITPTKKL